MSTSRSLVVADEPARPFASLTALQIAHNELLKRTPRDRYTTAYLTEIAEFIQRGRATGALLDSDGDRRHVQSILDRCAIIMQGQGHHPPDATLAPFDPTLAPDLGNSLCPYLGLDAFHEMDHPRFFGRQQAINELVERLKTNRLLVVVGPSGSGKSSLVMGGLLPTLKRGALPDSQNWLYYPPIVPSSMPLDNLFQLIRPIDALSPDWISQQTRAALRSPTHLVDMLQGSKQPAVLIIDQFEEMLTLCDYPVARQAFITNLLVLTQIAGFRHTVILTIRSDFVNAIALIPRFQQLFENAQAHIMPLGPGELREAIEKPAERIGLKFEDGVIDKLIMDIVGEPTALPLLQFTLLKLWENRERNRVMLESYLHLGGGRQALARSADAFYEALIPEEQVTIKRILLRMVRPGEGLEVTSSRIQREDLYVSGEAPDRVDRVLSKLIQARLVRLSKRDISTDVQVEVAHEALVRNWPTLVGWLENEREMLRRRQRLTTAAQQWEASGRDPDTLLRGRMLSEVLPYQDRTKLESQFVRASLSAGEENYRRELQQAQALAKEQERRAEAEAQRAREQERRAEAEAQRAREQERRAEAEAQRAEEQERRAEAEYLAGRVRLAAAVVIGVTLLAVAAMALAVSERRRADFNGLLAEQYKGTAQAVILVAHRDEATSEAKLNIASTRLAIEQTAVLIAQGAAGTSAALRIAADVQATNIQGTVQAIQTAGNISLASQTAFAAQVQATQAVIEAVQTADNVNNSLQQQAQTQVIAAQQTAQAVQMSATNSAILRGTAEQLAIATQDAGQSEAALTQTAEVQAPTARAATQTQALISSSAEAQATAAGEQAMTDTAVRIEASEVQATIAAGQTTLPTLTPTLIPDTPPPAPTVPALSPSALPTPTPAIVPAP